MGFYYTRDTLAQKRKSFESFANTAFLYGAHVAEAKCRYVLHLSPPLITRSTKRSHGASRPIACAARALKRSPSSTRSPQPGAVYETLI